MREVKTVEELRSLQMQTMDVIDAFCKEQGLSYSLAGGTLIGAIRHKGYIPWDDDIDIYMPRADYDKFLKTFDGFNSRYKIYEWRDYPGMEILFAKVGDTKTRLSEQGTMREYGVNVDVFPLDGVPADEKAQRKLFYKKLSLYILAHGKSQKYPSQESLSVKLRWIASKLWPLSKKATFNRIYKLITRYPDSEIVTNMVSMGSNNPTDAFSISLFHPTKAVPFEDRQYQIMSGYDTYLRKRFGDYMKLPPEEKRVGEHNLIAYIDD